jgi:DNA-binding MarR family transcriptional regulator
VSILIPKSLPRYECLLEAAKRYPDLDPSACEAFLHLLQVGSQMMHGCEAYFTGRDLSQGRFAVLMQLIDKTDSSPLPRTPAELAESTGVTRATMTGLVDTLERDGLVTREPDPQDRRTVPVQLTAKGLAVLQDVLPGHFKRMAELMAPLSEAERKTLVQLLTKIIRP